MIMAPRVVPLIAALLTCAACQRVEESAPVKPRSDAAGDPSAPVPAATPLPAPDQSHSPSAEPPETRLVAQALVLEQWEKADNRRRCAPIAFAATGGARGAPRPANFGGGWAVAFDLPNLRSAYGVAGPGLIPTDDQGVGLQRARLAGQWPYFRDLATLPQPAFAGYGIEGAAPYPDDNPNGRGVNSLAYLRVDGQACTYNVWSRLGRAHLETLLDELRMVPVG
jgi:hypothetical protein